MVDVQRFMRIYPSGYIYSSTAGHPFIESTTILSDYVNISYICKQRIGEVVVINFFTVLLESQVITRTIIAISKLLMYIVIWRVVTVVEREDGQELDLLT